MARKRNMLPLSQTKFPPLKRKSEKVRIFALTRSSRSGWLVIRSPTLIPPLWFSKAPEQSEGVDILNLHTTFIDLHTTFTDLLTTLYKK